MSIHVVIDNSFQKFAVVGQRIVEFIICGPKRGQSFFLESSENGLLRIILIVMLAPEVFVDEFFGIVSDQKIIVLMRPAKESRFIHIPECI